MVHLSYVLVDMVFDQFIGDEFLRLIIIRFIFCYEVLRLHKDFKVCTLPLQQSKLNDFLDFLSAKFAVIASFYSPVFLINCFFICFFSICYLHFYMWISLFSNVPHPLVITLENLLCLFYYSYLIRLPRNDNQPFKFSLSFF